jgi:ceramide glucosyltransferase
LAARARGELWFWSDSDIIAPPGLLTMLRRELAQPGTNLVTCPYRIRRLDAVPALLETLFVNVEFLPGVLACRQFDAVRFGFGAGLFFRAATFRERVRWEELGERLADDNLLSQRLAPVRLSAVTVDTWPAAGRWPDAVLHYLRWKKTVRWCAPVGFAGLIVITPVLGWLVVTAWQPGLLWNWFGLLVTIHLEALAAWCICRRLGCSLPGRWALVGWSLARALAWGACWLPWPIVFRSQRRMWWGLYQSQPCGGES